MIPRRRVLAGLAASALPFQARAEDMPADLTSGEILETATGEALTFTDLLDRLEQADTILIGERHGFAPHQDRVALILEELALRGRFPTLALEMLEPAQMPALDTYRKNNPEYVGGLGAALNWSESGWPSWHFYEPIFRAAFRAKLDILAADMPREEQRRIDRIGRTGFFPEQSLADYWKPIVRDTQCNDTAEVWIRNVTVRQVIRDMHMADVISAARSASIMVVGYRHMAPISTLVSAAVSLGLGTSEDADPTFVWDLGAAEAPSAC
ncbi:ChaN family lipoprotein [Sagittula sp. S175]|uniref:ChaN family lipoprotein n=1 Tax=Sagittula sp. S175 TaxID=3415129 RepID=UPI003C7BA864